MRGIISRFAPAPTGFLHLGHVVNAACVWRETRARSGRILLRIEDHDRQRSRREFEAAILDDLAWLGFEADQPLVRQSERSAIYEEALDRLRALGLVYACSCSRAEIAEATAGLKACTTTAGSEPTREQAGITRAEREPTREQAGNTNAEREPEGAQARATAAGDPEVVQALPPPLARSGGELRRGAPDPLGEGGRPADGELCYPGTCRDRGVAEGPGVGLRVRLEPSVERFTDLRLGPQEQRPFEQCGDLLVRDRDGNWTYQFAAAVDDLVQGITLVVRGVDLLASTGRQIQLARLLGRAEPAMFLHHALIMKSPTQKLSKSDGDSGIRELRAAGWTPAAVIAAALTRAAI